MIFKTLFYNSLYLSLDRLLFIDVNNSKHHPLQSPINRGLKLVLKVL